MSVQRQIDDYVASQPATKRGDMQTLHRLIMSMMPACQLWFLDGTDGEGRTVSNPNIGYGLQTMTYAGGKTREFYRVGISANTTGISVYILGIKDKTYLARTYGDTIGRASITGYCIKFKSLKDINIDALSDAIRHGLEAPHEGVA